MLKLFFTALMFYTRIPCPSWVDHSEDALNRSTVFFPLIGILVGLIGCGAYLVGSFAFPPELAVVLTMFATVWTTGAFHEDGLADVCDGFGGGWTQAKILDIMKDSRLGTYGAAGLFFVLITKFFALKALFGSELLFNALLIYVSAHSLSRFAAMTFIYTDEYVRENEDAKAKPVAKKLTKSALLLGAMFGIAPLLVLIFSTQIWFYGVVILPVFLVKWRLGAFFKKWIGGYTGDCLGATQQLTELTVYLFFISLKWISI